MRARKLASAIAIGAATVAMSANAQAATVNQNQTTVQHEAKAVSSERKTVSKQIKSNVGGSGLDLVTLFSKPSLSPKEYGMRYGNGKSRKNKSNRLRCSHNAKLKRRA